MNSFKLTLKVNSRKSMDEIICKKIIFEMRKLCRDIKEEYKVEDNDEIRRVKIEQIENRIRGISKIFMNYQRNMENIRENESRNKLLNRDTEHEINETDKELQKVLEKAENEMYKKVHKEEEKKQVSDRITGIRELLENFDDDMQFILKLEMQQTKMGDLIYEEEKTS